MKTSLLAFPALVCAVALHAQSTFDWGNRIPGVLLAPIYGQDPAEPTAARQGNTASGLPAGTQTYAGPLLVGTGFSAQLFVGPVGAAETSLVPWSGAPATFGVGAASGFYGAASVSALSPVFVAQVRVWDNRGGSVAGWNAVLADASVARGASELLTIDLGTYLPGQTPYLRGLESFQLQVVPEPSVFLLAIGGAGMLLAVRRRRE